jgi:hypothetical protein
VVITRHGLRTPTHDLPFDTTPWNEGLELLTMSRPEGGEGGFVPLEAMYKMVLVDHLVLISSDFFALRVPWPTIRRFRGGK